MDDIINDVRFAARQLRKRSGFTVIALLTFGLGIGATTTMFSIVNTMLVRELPYHEAGRLVVVEGRDPSRAWRRTGLSFPELEAIREGVPALAGAAGFAERAYNLGGGEEPQRARGAATTRELFDLLGVNVTVGRGFLPAEFAPGGDRVLVLSHRLWDRAFDGDGTVLGRTLLLNGEPHTVVGVAPDGFDYPSGVELWTPLVASAAAPRDDRSLQVIARLAPGATLQAAQQQLQALSRALDGDVPDPAAGWVATASPMRSALGGKFGSAAIALLTVTGIVLLIACANLANLQLVLMSARRNEMVLRAALGAGRARMVRLLVTEGVILALAGGLIGLILARWAVNAFPALMGTPVGISVSEMEFSIDYRVLLFSLLVSLGAGLAVSLSAAMRGSQVDLRTALQSDSRTAGSGTKSQRLRRSLVIAQIALSLPLVIGAAAVMFSSQRIQEVRPGFDTERLVALRVSLEGQAYDSPEERVAFVEQVLTRLLGIPQVVAVTAASHVPLIDRNTVPWVPFSIQAGEADDAALPSTSLRFVVGNYHQAMGVPMVQGRGFTDEEARATTPRVAVVNQTLARRSWPDQSAIGQQIRLGEDDPDAWLTVVGVAGDVMQRGMPAAPENQVYLPFPAAKGLTLMLRFAGDHSSVIPAAREIVRSVDPTLPLYDVRTMDDAIAWFTWDRLSQGIVLGSLGAVALLLALLGVYGVMSLMVAQRTREFGLRMALGGEPRDVLGLVLRRGLRLVGAGTAIGLILALVVTRGLAALFPNFPAFQPVLFVCVAGLLAAAVLLASYLPARRATHVDPMVSLRTE